MRTLANETSYDPKVSLHPHGSRQGNLGYNKYL